MSHWKQTMQARWQQLSAREQRLLGLMVLLVGGALYYLLLWQPAQQQSARLAAKVSQLQAEAQLVSSLAAEARRLQAQPALTPLPASELSLLLQPLLQQHGLAALQLQAQGRVGVRVQGEAVFDDWVRFCGLLATRQVRVLTLQAQATASGRVQLEAVLAHAGAEP